MRDRIVRQAFHETILKSAHEDAETFVVDELGLKNGEIRADIAVLNGKLIGYEIKTEKDTLARLPSQIKAYNEVFDKVFIIVSSNHLNKACQFIPDWWGIYTIVPTENAGYVFPCIRQAKINRNQDSFSIAQLLWKSEALEVANILLSSCLKSRVSKQEIYNVISTNCCSKKLSKIVVKYLKQRGNWRTSRVLPL